MRKIISIITLCFISCESGQDQNDLRNIEIFRNTEIWELGQAADDGDNETFSRLVKQKSDKLDVQEKSHGFTLLMWCVKMEKYEMVKSLLQQGADPDVRSNNGKTALFYATEYSWLDDKANPDPKYVELLLQFKADPNLVYSGSDNSNVIEKGTSPLIHASSRSFEKVKALVEGGADINYKTSRNWTAANQALLDAKVDIAHYLIVAKKARIIKPYYYYKTGSDSLNYDDERQPVGLLRDWVFELGSEEHRKKMEIVEEFSRQGADYWKTSPGITTLNHIKKRYPVTWEEYLPKY